MADTGILAEERSDLCANELLNFVSNASKQLKSLLGEVQEDLQPSHSLSPTHSLPSPQFLSPVPSPTPSSVSSISEQEVPSMSPGLPMKKAQRRRRKRDHESSNDITMVQYPMKVRRGDSLGDYDEFVSRVPTASYLWMQPQTRPSCQMENNNLKTYNSCRYERSPPPYSRQQPEFPMHDQIINRFDISTTQSYLPSPTTNYFSNCFYEQQQENLHDFEDMVSWMLAENVVDCDTLTALLNQC